MTRLVPAQRTEPPAAQTITISSGQLGKELADRLRQAVSGFVVYRSAYYVRLHHLPCGEILRTTAYTSLTGLLQPALEHECPGPRPGGPE